MAFWVPNDVVATFSAKFAVYRAASTPYFYKEEGTKQRGARRLDGKLLAPSSLCSVGQTARP